MSQTTEVKDWDDWVSTKIVSDIQVGTQREPSSFKVNILNFTVLYS